MFSILKIHRIHRGNLAFPISKSHRHIDLLEQYICFIEPIKICKGLYAAIYRNLQIYKMEHIMSYRHITWFL